MKCKVFTAHVLWTNFDNYNNNYIVLYDCSIYLGSLATVLAALFLMPLILLLFIYEGWNFNSGNYLFTTDAK